jgi:3-mercaptopyruvate sulfurtransferase SseA
MNLNRTLILTTLAVAAALGALWWTNAAVTPKEATWDDVLSEAESGGYRIITTEELGAKYSKNPDELLLVDTRQEWEYRTGHIKGAVNFPMEPTGWSRWRKADALKALLGSDKDRQVIFY